MDEDFVCNECGLASNPGSYKCIHAFEHFHTYDFEAKELEAKLKDTTDQLNEACSALIEANSEVSAMKEVLFNLSEYAGMLVFSLTEHDQVHINHFARMTDDWIMKAQEFIRGYPNE